MIKMCHEHRSGRASVSPQTCGDGSRLASGRFDEALPTTVALAEHYGVSQATVTRVLRSLAAEGLVRTVPRWGTFRA